MLFDNIKQDEFMDIDGNVLKKYYGHNARVVIPDNIEIIDEFAFENSLYLKEIILNNSLKEIKDYAFSGCKSLEEIYIPKSVIDIGEGIFSNTFIKSIKVDKENKRYSDLSKNIIYDKDNNSIITGSCNDLKIQSNTKITIKENAFSENNSLRYIEIDAPTIEILNNAFLESIVEDVRLNANIIKMDDFSFASSLKLKKVCINEFKNGQENHHEIYIGNCAFQDSLNLKSFDILYLSDDYNEVDDSNNIFKIESLSFSGCKSLERLPKIVNYLDEICDLSFNNCRSIKSIYISKKVKKISNTSFNNLTSLEKIEVDPNNEIYHSIDNSLMKDTNLILGNKNSIIPIYANRICSNAFLGCHDLLSIDLKNIEIIESAAFSNCINLKSIIFPSNLSSISSNAFSNSKSLESVIGNNIIDVIPSSCFYGCESLVNVKNFNNLHVIEESAFQNCYKLIEMEDYDLLETIKESAFDSCISLKRFYIGNNLVSLDKSAFFHCKNLNNIITNNNERYSSDGEYLYDKLNHILLKGNSNGYIPIDTRELNKYCFMGNDSIKEMIIPHIEYIGDACFKDCTSLEKVILNDELIDLRSNTFENCISLNTIDIIDDQNHETGSFILPSKLDMIDYEVFKNCHKLKNIYINKNLKNLEADAFSGCYNLSGIILDINNEYFHQKENSNCLIDENNILILGSKDTIIPPGVVAINPYAFYNALNLTEISLPSSMNIIYNNAFSECRNLKKIELNDELSIIEFSAFKNCSSLNSINIGPNIKEIYGESFKGCSNLEYIEVNKNNKVYYSDKDNSSLMERNSNILIRGTKNINLENINPRSIDSFALDSIDIKNITIPSNTIYIGYNAFSNSNLEVLSFHNNLSFIERNALTGCNNFKYFNLIEMKEYQSLLEEEANANKIDNYIESINYHVENNILYSYPLNDIIIDMNDKRYNLFIDDNF